MAITEAKNLSADAKAVLGSALHGGCALQFQLIESRPTRRIQDALDELVSAGFAVKENLPMRADGKCGVRYRACIPTGEFVKFAMKAKGLIIVEPIP